MSEACSPEAEGTVVLSDHENQTWIDADRFPSMFLLRATRKLLLSTCEEMRNHSQTLCQKNFATLVS